MRFPLGQSFVVITLFCLPHHKSPQASEKPWSRREPPRLSSRTPQLTSGPPTYEVLPGVSFAVLMSCLNYSVRPGRGDEVCRPQECILVPPLPLKKKKKHVFLPKRVGWPLDSSVSESSDSLTPSTGTQVPCPSSFLLSFPPYLPSFFPFFFTLLEAKNTFLFCTLDPATGASHLEKGRGFACVTTLQPTPHSLALPEVMLC